MQLDPDLLADIVHGELRVDMVNGRALGGQAEANRDSHSTSTTETHNVNYAVSPRELSLRLHEVIQFRLEEQIEELEGALHHSQKQLEHMKAERVLSQSQRAFSNSEMGSCSDPESPVLSSRDGPLSQPLCLNLSGDALHAYDEACEEFMRIADNEEDLPLTANTSKGLYVDGLLRSDWSPVQDKEYIAGGELSVDTRPPRTVSRDSSDAGESNDSDDEEGKILIQQIIERTRQGSPSVVLHAQRMLFAIDE